VPLTGTSGGERGANKTFRNRSTHDLSLDRDLDATAAHDNPRARFERGEREHL